MPVRHREAYCTRTFAVSIYMLLNGRPANSLLFDINVCEHNT